MVLDLGLGPIRYGIKLATAEDSLVIFIFTLTYLIVSSYFSLFLFECRREASISTIQESASFWVIPFLTQHKFSG